MAPATPADIRQLEDALAATEREARDLAAGLTDDEGGWRPEPGAWSVAECIDHLAVANRAYLRAMQPPAERALSQGRTRRRAARPGVIGGWFVRTLEPPAKRPFRQKAPRSIRPRTAPPLGDALEQFLASQDEVRQFLRKYGGIDLAGVRFPNPFINGVRFSLATGLHVIVAHERRHLWQASRVREAHARSAST